MASRNADGVAPGVAWGAPIAAGDMSRQEQLLYIRELISDAILLIESDVGDAEVLAHLNIALAELDAEIVGRPN